MKTAVVYYSRSGQNYFGGSIKNLEKGNAQKIVEMIKQTKDVDVIQIQTVNAYPEDYTECTKVAKKELNNNERPQIINKESLEGYQNIILVYPNWWSTMPMALWTYLESQNLSEKDIYPICTHEGSGMGVSEKDIKKLCPKAIVHSGLAIKGTQVDNSEHVIQKYIKNI